MKHRMARTWAAALAAALLLICLAPAALAAIPDRPANGYVLDSAGVLDKATEEEIIRENQRIFEAYGAEMCVAAVDFFGGEDADTYAYTMFDRWGVGSQERNNGILLVLGVGEEDYYALSGYGIDDYFDGAKLDDMLYEYLEPDFAAQDYDAGVKKFFRAVVAELDGYYAGGTHNQAPAAEAQNPYEDAYEGDSGFQLNTGRLAVRIVSLVIRVVVFILVIVLIVNLLRRAGRGGGSGGYRGGYRGSTGSGFWRGMFVGSMMNNRRRNRWGPPPPPPPPPPGGFGGFGGPGPGGPRPPSGGFGGSRPSGGFGSRPTSRPGGFSSGGRSGFGGSGRSSGGRSSSGRSSGGGFRSGGGTHGGGAGRRR